MSTIGQIEKQTQARVVALFRDRLGYDYLGNWIDRSGNANIEMGLLPSWLKKQGVENILINRAMLEPQRIVEKGPDAVNTLPKSIGKNEEAVAETIENNVRRIITNESPVDPTYYEQISKLLDALIEQRRKSAVSYHEYLEKIAKLARDATMPSGGPGYPAPVKTAAQRALYNNLGENVDLALAVDAAVQGSRQDGWRDNAMKTRKIRLVIRDVLQGDHVLTDQILELAKHQHDY